MALVRDEGSGLIFIHIYKTGGTSIRSLISGGREIGDIHSPARQIREILKDEDPLLWERAFKFAIVRNPYDLIISLYNHLHFDPSHFLHPIAMEDIDRFILDLDIHHFRRCSFEGYQFLATQWYFLSDEEGVIVDQIYRFEEMDSIVEDLSRWVGTPNIPIHLNRNKFHEHESFADHLSPESIAIVNRLYLEDFIHLGYQPLEI